MTEPSNPRLFNRLKLPEGVVDTTAASVAAERRIAIVGAAAKGSVAASRPTTADNEKRS